MSAGLVPLIAVATRLGMEPSALLLGILGRTIPLTPAVRDRRGNIRAARFKKVELNACGWIWLDADQVEAYCSAVQA